MDRIARFVILLTLIVFYSGQTEAGWQVKQKQTSSNGTPWVLSSDGSITRGDPKTSYDQEENQAHSNRVDITGWTFHGQGGSAYAHYDGYAVTYLNPASTYKGGATPKQTIGTIDRVAIFYDILKGQVTGAVREYISYVHAMPDLTGMTLDGKRNVRSDGTGSEVWWNNDRTANAVVYYDAGGQFQRAVTWQEQDLNPNKVTAPPYCTQTYGCIK